MVVIPLKPLFLCLQIKKQERMMKNYFLFACLGIMALTSSCKDDNHPITPELNKVTKISCYKNDGAIPEFVADINYTSDGKISNIQFTGEDKLLFIYSDNRFTVTNVNSGTKNAEYTLSGDVIIQKKISKENQYASNEIYASDEYDYKYLGTELSYTSWTTRWPKENGKGYEERSYPNSEIYKWENGNAVLYTQDKKEMKYEYGALENPGNFPLRVIASFSPVGFDAVTPLNLQYGARNRNLPERAYTYNVTNPTAVNSEFTYGYLQVGDYITTMTITERATGGDGSLNTYKFSFEYNYVVK